MDATIKFMAVMFIRFVHTIEKRFLKNVRKTKLLRKERDRIGGTEKKTPGCPGVRRVNLRYASLSFPLRSATAPLWRRRYAGNRDNRGTVDRHL